MAEWYETLWDVAKALPFSAGVGPPGSRPAPMSIAQIEEAMPSTKRKRAGDIATMLEQQGALPVGTSAKITSGALDWQNLDALKGIYAQRPISQAYPGLAEAIHPAPQRVKPATLTTIPDPGIVAAAPGTPTLPAPAPTSPVPLIATDAGQPIKPAPPTASPDTNAFLRTLVGALPATELPNVYRTEMGTRTKDAALTWREEFAKQQAAARLERDKDRTYQQTTAAQDRRTHQDEAQRESTRRRYLQTAAHLGVPEGAMQPLLDAATMPDVHQAFNDVMQKTLVPVVMEDGTTRNLSAAQAEGIRARQASIATQQQRQAAMKGPEQQSLERRQSAIDARIRQPFMDPKEKEVLLKQSFANRIASIPYTYPHVQRVTMTGQQLAEQIDARPEADRQATARELLTAMVIPDPKKQYLITGVTPEEAIAIAAKYNLTLP